MQRAGLFFRRRIDREELQRLAAGVHEVVARAGRDEHEVVCAHRLRHAVETSFTAAAEEYEDLIHRVRFFPDLLPGRDTHQYELTVAGRCHFLAEEFVAAGEIVDIDDQWGRLGWTVHGHTHVLLSRPVKQQPECPRAATYGPGTLTWISTSV